MDSPKIFIPNYNPSTEESRAVLLDEKFCTINSVFLQKVQEQGLITREDVTRITKAFYSFMKTQRNRAEQAIKQQNKSEFVKSQKPDFKNIFQTQIKAVGQQSLI